MTKVILFCFIVLVTGILFVIGFDYGYENVYGKKQNIDNDKIIHRIEVDITAYSPSPHITAGDPFIMASGKKANVWDLHQLRYVALSRDLIEEYGICYGDKIFIAFEVQDTMNPRIGNTVDLFMRNLALARNFGRQKREIIIRKK